MWRMMFTAQSSQAVNTGRRLTCEVTLKASVSKANDTQSQGALVGHHAKRGCARRDYLRRLRPGNFNTPSNSVNRTSSSEGLS